MTEPGDMPAVREPDASERPRRVARRGRRARGRMRAVRFVVIAAVVLALLPVVLTALYAVPSVHPVSTLMIADLLSGQGYDRRWVSLDEVSPSLVNAVMMSEDGQFCSHEGIDFGALNEVLGDALDGEATRGASTIPMQTVKNLYLWSGRSYVRKAMEAPLALFFDAVLSKRRIMEIYLNIAEWGPNIYGIEAAAQAHFGRSAKDLTLRQSALLAVTLPNPIERDPARPSAGMRRLASIVERRARRAGDYNNCVE